MSRWTEKPVLGSQINWNHPLSKGLVGVWLMNEGAGNKVNDVINNNDFINLNTYPGITWDNNILGKCIRVTASNNKNYLAIYTPTKLKLQNLTLVWFGIPNLNFVSGQVLAGVTYTVSFAAPYYSYAFRHDGTTTSFGFNNGTFTSISGSIVATVLGKKTMLVGTFTSGNQKLYQNGTLVGSGTTSGNISYGAESILQIGSLLENGNGADTNNMLIYNRALSASEVKELYISPYQFIYKPRRVFYSIPETPPTTSTTAIMTCMKGYW